MLKKLTASAAAAAMLIGAGAALAELPEGYVGYEHGVEGHPLPEVISGYWYRDPATRAMQDDDFENPGMIMVDEGADLWATVDGTEGKSCQTCHGDAAEAMKGVVSTYPKFTGTGDKRMLRNVEDQINFCRTENMGASPWKYDSAEGLAMTIFVKAQDRGVPVNITVDDENRSAWEQGKEIYYTRNGQLDMSCATCHEDHNGQYIRADHLSQGQINGFPTYRLKWQGVGSTHKRFKGCIEDTRGEPYGVGSDEFKALELYVAWRGQGVPVETPAVRQ